MWWFTLAFGLFGLHHLLMRSTQTFILFLIVNLFTLGYWWAYDLLQLSKHSTDKLNEEGLHSPWGPLGIAQGMWRADDSPEPTETETSPPSPWWFFAFALTIPLAPIAMWIAGDEDNAFFRIGDLTVIPFGFLFYGISILVDYWSILANPADFFMFGAKRTFPFPQIFGMDPDQHSPRITLKKDYVGCPPEGLLMGTARFVSKGVLPVVAQIPVVGAAAAAANTALNSVLNAYDAGKQVANQGLAAAAGFQSVAAGVPAAVNAAFSSQVGKLSNSPLPTAPPELVNENNTQKVQGGGGTSQADTPFTPTDFVATAALGAVILGGVTLGVSRLLENGGPEKSDLPPSLIA
jgi:hypothetical protein